MRPRSIRDLRHRSKKSKLVDKIRLPKKDYMSTITAWTVFIYFISAILIISNYSYFMLKVVHFVQLFCFFLAIAFLVPIRLYRRKLNMSYYEYVFINFLGLAPLLMLFCFGINLAFKGDSYTETYRIVNSISTNGNMTYILENNKYEDYEHVRSIDLTKEVEIEGNTFLSIQFSDGLLGIRMIEKHRVH